MKSAIAILAAYIGLLLCSTAMGQAPDGKGIKQIPADRIYDDQVHTVLLHPPDQVFAWPVIRLNSEEQLLLSFDDFRGGFIEYKYRYVHCDEQRKPSDMNRSLYVSGYPDATISEYGFSRNTLQDYTHYSLLFPDEDMQILRSGNYLLQVYTDEPDEPAFECYFYVVEDLVRINANVVQPSGINNQYSQQEIKMNLAFESGFSPHIPAANIHPWIFQNGSMYNCKNSVEPVSVGGSGMSYDLPGRILFDGGNEFRNFDAKDLSYQSEFIQSIDMAGDTIEVVLRPDRKKNQQAHKSEPDINGRFLVKNDKAHENGTEEEYIRVHFSYPVLQPLAGGELYLNGALLNRELNEKSRLNYNFRNHAYELELYLKQGYYNYQYVQVDTFTGEADISACEGNFYETGNEYSILVYYHDVIENYDRLCGFTTLESRLGVGER